jgi:hypothetical protein
MGYCSKTAVLSAPIDRVWAAVSDFHNMDYANGVISSVDKVGKTAGDKPGALNSHFTN